MNCANPFICSSKYIRPLMATSNVFLQIYLKQAEKAHSILNFIYNLKQRRRVFKEIRDKLLGEDAKKDAYVFEL